MDIRQGIDNFIDKLHGAALGVVTGHESLEKLQIAAHQLDLIKENNADLQLAADDVGWASLSSDLTQKLIARPILDQTTRLARIMYLLNPLIKRAVTVAELYVWGSGVSIKAEDSSPEVQGVLDNFYNDPGNQCALGNTNSWAEREREQRIEGNTFFMFFVNKRNGALRVRTTNIDEIQDIYCNPEDKNEPWFYLRTLPNGQDQKWYPDINYTPYHKGEGPDAHPIDWNVRVLHTKTGGLPGMKFGISELYSVLNWATAYKGILENFATILKAYAKIAWKLTGQKTAKGVAGSRTKFQTSITTGDETERNPPPNVASMMIASGNVDLAAVKTAGSTTGPDEARALRSMVAAGTDTPEHFFGDSDIGNFATSTTLDRPTELKMIARQQMWTTVIATINRVIITSSIKAPQGILKRAGYELEKSPNTFDGSDSVKFIAPANKSARVTIKFPAILERNVTDRVRAVVQAATLGGSPAEGIFPDRKLLFTMLLDALGEPNANYIAGQLYSEPVLQGWVNPADKLKNETVIANARAKTADAQMVAAKQPAPKPAAAQ